MLGDSSVIIIGLQTFITKSNLQSIGELCYMCTVIVCVWVYMSISHTEHIARLHF